LPVIIFDDFTTDIKYVDFPFKVKSSAMKILHVDKNKADIKYIFNLMKLMKFNSLTHKRYWISEYSKIQIPLPPLEVQEKIAAEIKEYEKIINGAKEIVDNWKPKIEVSKDWEMVELKNIIKLASGDFLPSQNQQNGDYFIYGGNGIIGMHNKYNLERQTVIIGRVGAYCGNVHLTK
jgi:hypothetical protein